MRQAEACAEAARDKRKREDEPKPEVKKVSTGKTDAMLAGLGSPEINFFGKNSACGCQTVTPSALGQTCV